MVDDNEPGVDIDLLAASLRADGADLATFTEALATKLTDALPGATQVRRGGLLGRGGVQAIAVDAGGERLELHVRRGSIETVCSRVSGGITLKTEPIGTDEWLDRLSGALAAEAQRSQITRQALERLLYG
jgi:hypothetical protein